jgi:anti-sigma B factor antagonist
LAIDTVAVDEHTAVVSPRGDLDLWSAPELKRRLRDLIAARRTQLILDLAAVQFMDSTALGVLVAIDRQLADEVRLVIARPGKEVLRLFELSGVARAFRVFPAVEDAIAAIREETSQPAPKSPPPPSTDTALLLGIAATAMPFAQSVEEQAERWLRALRRHGEAGALLASFGVREEPVSHLDEHGDPRPSRLDDADPVTMVTEHAGHVALVRGSARVTTIDVLTAVSEVYGEAFARALRVHGVPPEELAEGLADAQPNPGEVTP